MRPSLYESPARPERPLPESRSLYRGRTRIRRRRVLGTLLLIVVAAVALIRLWPVLTGEDNFTVLRDDGAAYRIPKVRNLSPLRRRIVAIAESQIGYTTAPSDTYCNKFSAYWQSGSDDCGNANLDEEWCADFAAWAWQHAGVALTYADAPGEINSASASFYSWGLAHDTWHPAASGYTPQPGDVAVYGLDPGTLVAVHVAVVVGDVQGEPGPIAVNGDGDLTGFSVVEVRASEYYAVIHPNSAPLSGYVSPN